MDRSRVPFLAASWWAVHELLAFLAKLGFSRGPASYTFELSLGISARFLAGPRHSPECLRVPEPVPYF